MRGRQAEVEGVRGACDGGEGGSVQVAEEDDEGVVGKVEEKHRRGRGDGGAREGRSEMARGCWGEERRGVCRGKGRDGGTER